MEMFKGISRRLRQIFTGSKDPVLPESADPTLIKMRGWRQGCVLTQDLLKILLREQFSTLPYRSANEINSESGLGIVISQDCDVVSSDYEKEPYIEILLSKQVPNSTQLNEYRYGRAPRMLIFDVQMDEDLRTYAASIHDRFRIPRQYLESYAPDTSRKIAPDQKRIIILWLVKRYSRKAFPDEFNERLKPYREKLKKFAKRNNEYLSAIRIRIEPFDEVEKNKSYQVNVILQVDQRKIAEFDPPPNFDKISADFEMILGECEGIEVDGCEIVMEEDCSLTDAKEFPVWDSFDYLSLSSDQESDILDPSE